MRKATGEAVGVAVAVAVAVKSQLDGIGRRERKDARSPTRYARTRDGEANAWVLNQVQDMRSQGQTTSQRTDSAIESSEPQIPSPTEAATPRD